MNDEIETQEYRNWIADLKRRYRATQVKAAVAVNSALIEYYWGLGRDISEKYSEFTKSEIYGKQFFQRLSADLKDAMPGVAGHSTQNLRYCLNFYELYASTGIFQQLVGKSDGEILQQPVGKSPVCANGVKLHERTAVCADNILPQVVAKLVLVPWGHHVVLIDKCKGNCEKAWFYVCRTNEHGWSRDMLLNMLSTDLYEREGKAQTNFELTLPKPESDLAVQLVKDPQVFEVLGLEKEYQEADLKKALVTSIEKTILSFGRGVAFMGSEYPVELGGEEKLIDLLFYVVPLHRYLIVEVKTGKFEPADLGQLLGYKVMVKHSLNTPGDHEPIGLLICRDHNRILAQYMMDELKTPLGITDYEINRILPPVEKLQSALEALPDAKKEDATE